VSNKRECEETILSETGRIINGTARLDEQLDSVTLFFERTFSTWGACECVVLLSEDDGTLSIKADFSLYMKRCAITQAT